MRIALGSDHHGAETIRALHEHLTGRGFDAVVHGRMDGTACDYPIPAALVGRGVAAGEADRGILICGSGIGICIAANKIPGVRAALVHDARSAEMCRRHNDANVICFAGGSIDARAAAEWTDTFLQTPFEGGRHARRVAQIAAIERGEMPSEGT